MEVAEIAARCAYEAARTAPPPGVGRMPAIPVARYTGMAFKALEETHLWPRTWVCAGRAADLPEAGSYRLFSKLGTPILLVRGRDQEIRAFYNTCQHRGAPVVRDEAGRTTLLRCQFHSWSYGLDGRLIGVPDQQDFVCLDKSEHGLVPVRCESWDGWLFVNLDKDAEPLSAMLGSVVPELQSAGMADLRTVAHRSYMIAANWKTTMDAFLEVYHLNTIHPKTAGAALDHRFSTLELLPGGHSWQAVDRRQSLGNTMGGAGVPNIAGMADHFRKFGITYNVFPNLVAPIDPIGFPVLLMWPRGIDACEIEIYFVGPDWGEGPLPDFYESYFAFFEQLIQEDIMNLAPIQASLRSGAFSGPLLNYQERRIYWLHEAIDRQIGPERIPDGLAMAPVLTEAAGQAIGIAAE